MKTTLETYMEHADELGIQLQLFIQGTPQLTVEETQNLIRDFSQARKRLIKELRESKGLSDD